MSRRRPNRRSGITLIELLIGMSVTTIVMGAMAAFTLAVAQSWTSFDGTQSVQTQSTQVHDRVRFQLASAKYIGVAENGAIFYWANDNWGGISDEAPEVGEMALIQLNSTTQTLWLYQPIAATAMTPAQLTAASVPLTYSEITDPSWITTFKSLNYVTPIAVGHNVISANFAADFSNSTTQRPVVEITLSLNRSPQPPATQYETITLRAPTTQPYP